MSKFDTLYEQVINEMGIATELAIPANSNESDESDETTGSETTGSETTDNEVVPAGNTENTTEEPTKEPTEDECCGKCKGDKLKVIKEAAKKKIQRKKCCK